MNNNTQLPAEVVELINKDAEHYVHQAHMYFGGDESSAYIAGATEYATKLQDMQKEVNAAYAQATLIANKSAEWEQKVYDAWEENEGLKQDNDRLTNELNVAIKANENLCSRQVNWQNDLYKVQMERDAAKDLLTEVFQKHESGLLPDRFIYEKIKKFLYGE